MRILFTSGPQKLTPIFLSALASIAFFSAVPSESAAKDEEPKVKPEPPIVKASDTVEIVRIAIGLSQVINLQKEVESRFSAFESEILFDLSSEVSGVKNLTSNVTIGQSIGFVLPDFENYFAVAFPHEMQEEFGEDYELGEDAAGNATIDGQIVVKTDRYLGYAAVSEDFQLENGTQVARQLMDYATESENHLFAIESSPRTMGRSLMKNQLLAYRIALNTAAQRQDDESDLDYSYRSLTSGHFAKLIELFFRDVEKVRFDASSRGSEYPFTCEFSLECREKSALLSYFQQMQQKRNRSLSWLHPSADAFATISLDLPKRIQEQLLTAGTATAQTVQESGLNAQAVSQTEGVFRGLAEAGAFQALLQQVPFDENSACYVSVIPLSSGSVFDSELVQLISDQDSLTTITEIDGWPVYSADGWLDLDLADGWEPYVVATDTMLSLMMFEASDEERALALLTELVQREFSPARQGARYANAICAAEFSLADLVNFLPDNRDDWSTLLPNNMGANSGGKRLQLDQDQVLWTMSLDGHQVTAKFRFEPNSVAFGVLCFEALISVMSDIGSF